MVWKQIKKDVYAYHIDQPTEIVDVRKLKKRLKEIDSEVEEIQTNFLKYPDNLSDELKQAVDLYNEQMFGPMIADLESEKSEIISKLKEIGVWNGS